ncbi:MAG TPA: cyclase family protein [Pseudolabrys sp.]|nr:cyclase family protein [Pseudolabrys sp.]
MHLPKTIIDISIPLDNETVVDPPIMRPQIKYVSNKENAEVMCSMFPGLKTSDLPGGEGWAWEVITLTTHNGTHMDAPYHFHSVDKQGKPMMTIDEAPLDWFFRPGVKLDFRNLPDGHVVSAAEVEAELKRIGHTLKPLDIVLVNTKTSEMLGTDRYMSTGIGMGREATLYLTERGVRVVGIDAWGWDAPFVHTAKRFAETRDPSIIWEGHYAGIDIPYCQMEKLYNLEKLPATGFTVACFPCKIKAASGGWVRAVAMFD